MRRCSQPAAAELPYQELTLIDKTLNPGSPEILKILYKAVCILLTKTDCTWPALAAVHQRDVHREEGGRKGAGEKFLIRLLSRR